MKSLKESLKILAVCIVFIIFWVICVFAWRFFTTWELIPSGPVYKTSKEVCEQVKGKGFFPLYKLTVGETKQGELTPCRFKNSIGMTYATLNVGIFDKGYMNPGKYTIEVGNTEAHLRKFKMGNGQTLVIVIDTEKELLDNISKQLGFK
jgi:hypothetical protein